MEIQELFDYNVSFFDKGIYKEIQINYVVETHFDKIWCETTFKYISEMKDNIPVYSEITLPYARITKQHLLSYFLKDGVLCKHTEKEYTIRNNRHRSGTFFRSFKGLNRGWR